MPAIDKLNERAEEHYEANIGDYGWTQKYELQVDNGQVALLLMRNHGDGEYSTDVWTRLYTDDFLKRFSTVIDTLPPDGGTWSAEDWRIIQKLFHYHFSISVE